MAQIEEIVDVVMLTSTEAARTVVSHQKGQSGVCDGPVPTVQEYFAATGTAGLSLAAIGCLFFIVTIALYYDTLMHVVRRVPGPAKTHTAFIVSVYPVVSLCSLIALIVPRAQLVTESVATAVLMTAMYQLLCLFIDYCGGETQIVRSLTDAEAGKTPNVSLRVTPCCFPCVPLPDLPLTKRNFVYLRLMVLQLPIVQSLIYFVLTVASADTEGLGERLTIPMIAPILTSILIGIWGLKATLTSLAPLLDNPAREHHAFRKFIALQLVLLLTKLQGGLIKGTANVGWLPCAILPGIVLANVFYNCALLVEMCLLMAASRYLYKKEIAQTEMDPETAKAEAIRTVSAKVPPSTDNNNTIEKQSHRF